MIAEVIVIRQKLRCSECNGLSKGIGFYRIKDERLCARCIQPEKFGSDYFFSDNEGRPEGQRVKSAEMLRGGMRGGQ
jgi:hypothetical protein